jgi:uncharacterized protein (DUF362 family)
VEAIMRRRDFLAQVTAAAMAGAVLPVFDLGAAEPPAAGGPSVAVATGGDPAGLTRRAVEALGGMGAFVTSGQRVVVKPNIGWDRTVEQAANTHPEVVRALCEMCLAAGAKQVQVFDHTCNKAEACYANSGIAAACAAIGDARVRCEQLDKRRWSTIAIKDGLKLTEWDFYRDALEADVYINVPIAKHHGLTKLSLGLKNIMGVISGKRGSLHQDIGVKLADLHRVLRTHLTVMDATRILLRGGPQGGDLKDVKVLDTVAASTDPVAIDAWATTLFGLTPADIPYIGAAAAAGLGEMDLAKITVRAV